MYPVLVALQDAPTVVTGIDWTILIPVIVAGLVTIIGAVSAAVLAWQTKAKTVTIAETNLEQDVKLKRIEILVDGRYGQVLEELAEVRRLLAAESGLASDHDKANIAQQRADSQAARVTAATPHTPETPHSEIP